MTAVQPSTPAAGAPGRALSFDTLVATAGVVEHTYRATDRIRILTQAGRPL